MIKNDRDLDFFIETLKKSDIDAEGRPLDETHLIFELRSSHFINNTIADVEDDGLDIDVPYFLEFEPVTDIRSILKKRFNVKYFIN